MGTTVRRTARPESRTKDRRFNIRATEEEKTLVEQAARATRVTSSRFVLQAALRSAEEILADQTRFALPPDRWREFIALLDRPAREMPALRKAASKPSPFSDH